MKMLGLRRDLHVMTQELRDILEEYVRTWEPYARDGGDCQAFRHSKSERKLVAYLRKEVKDRDGMRYVPEEEAQ